MTVQRLRPSLLGYGDVHSGGLDGHEFARTRKARLWLRDDSDGEP